MAMMSGSAFLSTSLKCLVMLIVDRTNADGSMHDASVRESPAMSNRKESKHRRMCTPQPPPWIG
jgi:hypothetical protein